MALIKITGINKRDVSVTVTWDDVGTRNYTIPGVPVEDFPQAHAMMSAWISSQYDAVVQELARQAYNNPTPDPRCVQAIGHTFDNNGNLVS